MKFWEVKRLREGRRPRSYGAYRAENEDEAILRLLHTKGVAAYVQGGRLVYDKPINLKVWGTRAEWSVAPWVRGKTRQSSLQIKDRSVAMVQAIKGAYL